MNMPQEYSPTKFLIIEDHTALRRSLIFWLSSLFPRSEILEADSGERGLELAESESPDIVIVDIGLPGINGINVTQSIKKKNMKIEVIILTILDGIDYQTDALKAGADSFINKKDMNFLLPNAIRSIVKRQDLKT